MIGVEQDFEDTELAMIWAEVERACEVSHHSHHYRRGAPASLAFCAFPLKRHDIVAVMGAEPSRSPDAGSVNAMIEQLTAEWPAMVGPRFAAHSKPLALDDGVLKIEAENSAWATELRRSALSVPGAHQVIVTHPGPRCRSLRARYEHKTTTNADDHRPLTN